MDAKFMKILMLIIILVCGNSIEETVTEKVNADFVFYDGEIDESEWTVPIL